MSITVSRLSVQIYNISDMHTCWKTCIQPTNAAASAITDFYGNIFNAAENCPLPHRPFQKDLPICGFVKLLQCMPAPRNAHLQCSKCEFQLRSICFSSANRNLWSTWEIHVYHASSRIYIVSTRKVNFNENSCHLYHRVPYISFVF